MILDRQICRNSVVLMAVFGTSFKAAAAAAHATLYKSRPASFTIKVSGSFRKLS